MVARTVNQRPAIAVDLGGTQIRVGVIDDAGHIHKRFAEPTLADTDGDTVCQQIADLVAKACDGMDRSDIAGIGVSSPGPIDTDQGVTLGLVNIKGFDDFPLRAVLSTKLGRDIMLENDGIAAAIGEWQLGAGRGSANVVYVTVSTGIGGGVVVDNHVLRGRRGMAGHVGHMSIVPHGEICGCGNAGCLEAYASGPNFTKRANAAGIAGNAAAVFLAAKAGNRMARALVDQQALYLAQGFVSLLHLFSPDVLIMGGGMSQQFDVLYPMIAEYVGKYAMPAYRGAGIVRAALGVDSGLIGASRLVFMSR
jgi:glucokinase